MKGMKLVLKVVGGFFGFIFIVVIAAGIALNLLIDKPFVENQMKKALNRHVSIASINVGILSMISGIEVSGVKISNFKTEKELNELKDKPVSAEDLFVGLKSFKFKIKFAPLISKRIELKEVMLYEPELNIVRYKSGLFNFSDLLLPKKMTPEQKAEALKKIEEEAKKQPEKIEPPKALVIDDIPVEINIGKAGMEKGTVNYHEQKLDQRIQLYGVTAIARSILINAKDIDKKNQVLLDLNFGIKTAGKSKPGGVESFDIGFSAKGSVKPFDAKTRKLDPEISLKAGMPYGTITGLKIFEKLDSIEMLDKYTGKLAFLKKALVWKNAFVNVWYKAGLAKLTDGRLSTEDYALTFAGETNTVTKAIGMDLAMILTEKNKAIVKAGISGNVKKIMIGNMAKVIKPEQITDTAMKQLLNEKGEVSMKFRVSGTVDSPKSELVSPKLKSLSEILKDSAGNAGDAVKEKAAKKADAAKDKAKDSLKKKLKF